MILSQDTALFNACCAAVACSCAIYVAARDTLWRRHNSAEKLSERIDTAQKSADGWHETAQAREMKAETKRIGIVVDAHDGCLTHVATRTDIAEVKGAVDVIKEKGVTTAAAVDRIEGMLLKRALA